MSSWIVTEATTFEMELRGHKQATAHSHEHTKNSNPSKQISATTKFEFESVNLLQKPPKSFEMVLNGIVVLLRVSPFLFFLQVLQGIAGAIGVSNLLRAFLNGFFKLIVLRVNELNSS